MPDSLLMLGTGDAMGVPRLYCECSVCQEARTEGTNRRYRSAALLCTPAGELMIDCGPDFRSTMERIGRRQMDHMLITHPHFDHIAGLPEWADACKWLETKGTAYAPAEVFATLRKQFPWLEGTIDYRENDAGFEFGGWSIRPWRVFHGKNGYSYAYRFEKDGFSWAYCSDSINLQGEEKAPLFGLDLLVLGTTFYKEEAPFHTRSVYDVVEATALLQEVSPRRTVFTHMSHDIDLRNNYPLPPGASFARTGERLVLG